MNHTTRQILLGLVIFFLFKTATSAIECYQCNSEYDPRCGDPFDSYSLGKVNCSLKIHLEHLPNIDPVLCRKTTQISNYDHCLSLQINKRNPFECKSQSQFSFFKFIKKFLENHVWFEIADI